MENSSPDKGEWQIKKKYKVFTKGNKEQRKQKGKQKETKGRQKETKRKQKETKGKQKGNCRNKGIYTPVVLMVLCLIYGQFFINDDGKIPNLTCTKS